MTATAYDPESGRRPAFVEVFVECRCAGNSVRVDVVIFAWQIHVSSS